MLGMTPDTMKSALAGTGVPAELAAVTAEQVDDRMKDAVLKLYRSATNLGRGLAGGAGQRTPAGPLPLGCERSVCRCALRSPPGSACRRPRRRLRELRPLVAAGAPAGSRGRARSVLGLRLSRPRLPRRSNNAGCALAPSPASWTTPVFPVRRTASRLLRAQPIAAAAIQQRRAAEAGAESPSQLPPATYALTSPHSTLTQASRVG